MDSDYPMIDEIPYFLLLVDYQEGIELELPIDTHFEIIEIQTDEIIVESMNFSQVVGAQIGGGGDSTYKPCF